MFFRDKEGRSTPSGKRPGPTSARTGRWRRWRRSGWRTRPSITRFPVQNRDVVTLNIGDTVTIEHAVAPEGESVSILDGYTLTISRRAPRTYPGNE